MLHNPLGFPLPSILDQWVVPSRYRSLRDGFLENGKPDLSREDVRVDQMLAFYFFGIVDVFIWFHLLLKHLCGIVGDNVFSNKINQN